MMTLLGLKPCFHREGAPEKWQRDRGPVRYRRDEAEITTGQILSVDSGVTIY
jgi:hypothetical protein